MALFHKSKVRDGIATYGTGAQRSAQGVRYDVLSPIGLRRVAARAHLGAEKYGDFNVEKGLAISVLLNHALAHVYTYLEGNRDEDHLAAACWGLMFAIHSEELWPELNRDLRQPGCLPPAAAIGGAVDG
jgi:hypothetical protein